jgi:DNA-binding SARP family transcriptional activator/ABC-type branched-subunit amino acid transport system substrate-binding protein/DNA-binding beta-propeller fold protein YncE
LGCKAAARAKGRATEFRILGPLEVSDEGREIDIGGPRQRALLAVLLLHGNEVVSRDRLIDELWGDAPPTAAVKTLQAHVSRLRGALNGEEGASKSEGGRLETHGPGYLLRVNPGELDADRFQSLVDDARRTLAGGEPQRAAEGLRQALALWRGPALADFSYQSFARTEIARLDELQLTALEERVEADLELGRHGALVAELEALVARHPLRERLRGQLMLALYRSDRQAEALNVYQQGRRALAEELGLDPSQGLQRLERQILAQDPALALPERRARPPVAWPPGGRRARALILVGVFVLAAGIAAAVLQPLRDESATPVGSGGEAVEAPGARVLDSRTGHLRANIPLGTAPSSIAVGGGSVWVLDADDKTISRIDPTERRRLRTFSTSSTPTDLAFGANALWIGNAFRESHLFAGTNYPESVSRVDPQSGVVDETIVLPRAGAGQYFQGGGFSQQHIAATDSAVWVVNPDQTVSRIDPRTNRRVATVEGVQASDIAVGDGRVWVLGDGEVLAIDPRTSAVSRRIEVAAESLTALAVGAGAVWGADPLGGSIWRIDPSPEPLLRQIPLELGVRSVAFGQGVLWATNEIADKVYRIEPRTNRASVVSRLVAPQRVAVGNDVVYVTALGPPSGREALPASVCGEIFAGAGSPRFLIASDLPLQGPTRAWTVPMVEAIRFVLERRGFRAGRYNVGYQSCDDSTAQTGGGDLYRCFSNAKAYARNLEVIGVIGAFNSYCSSPQIPIANQAPRGPLAMISPSNTFTGLTRPYRAMRRSELEHLYPSGERNYVRIVAADHLSPTALVEAAKELGRTRLFSLWDAEDPYMAGFAADMRQAARRLGLQIAGTAAWNPRSRDFARLARQINPTKPEAILMAGAAPPHTGGLIRDLRAGLGPGVALIASDGFADFPALTAAAGPAAKGMYVGYAGLPDRKLPPTGRRFLEQFEEAHPGLRTPDFSAAYAAHATEILLDAIARSNGTRPSVARELRRTRIEGGMLGDIRFDRNGDLVEAPVTIFRVAGSGPVVDRVITVRSDSLR